MLLTKTLALLTGLALAGTGSALSLNVDDPDSVHAAASAVASGLMNYYDGYRPGGVVGMFVSPYYWWEAGAAWNSLLDFWFITGDDTYNTVLKKSLLHQVGANNDYLPSNQSMTEGNDDQGFWGITAMAAAERNFSNPTGNDPQWLYLAQAVFNQMVQRWDTVHCKGGLRWQIYTWNAGYDYKNTVSNGSFMNIAARLARYTGNSTYADWAEKIYDWLLDVGFIVTTGDITYVWDGAGIAGDCGTISNGEWTYNYGLILSACAFMYDYTNGSSVWETRATDVWGRAQAFFDNSIMYEAACDHLESTTVTCNNDQRCFRAIFSRFLGHSAVFLPSLRDSIMGYLNASAVAAAASCNGGSDGKTCGLNWSKKTWDGYYGLGEQMCALECIQNTQILSKARPLTAFDGGTSNGSTEAGMTSSTTAQSLLTDTTTVTSGDRARAAVATLFLLAALIGIGSWVIL